MKSGTKFGILGTGSVGQTVGARLAELGHKVFIGTRDPAATLARTQPDNFGNPPFKVWREQHGNIGFGTLQQAAAESEVLVNATAGTGSLAALEAAGAQNLAGKILIDIANPLDFSKGMPPSLTISNTDSLGEQLQRAHPTTKVVKALNTMNCYLMMGPKQLADADHTVFLCGNDAGAKTSVTELLQSLGWKDIVDVGDITAARGTEMILPLWVRLFGALKTPMFNFKLVR